MPQVLDYSSGFPNANMIAQAGYVGAVRYIGVPGNPKCTTPFEVEDFRAHGLGMALVYERNEGDWRGGYVGGQAAAVAARAHANEVGFPMDQPIYFAVDQDIVTSADFHAVFDYIRGACSVLGPERTGVYGEFGVCVQVATLGYARFYWQTRAWSGTPPQRYAGNLYQTGRQVVVAGVVCDVNDVLTADWGQHPAPSPWGATTSTGGVDKVTDNVPVQAGQNAHIAFTCAGYSRMRVPLGYRDQVELLQIDWAFDTPVNRPDPAFVPGAGFNGDPDGDGITHDAWVVQPNRPGPWTIPAGATEGSIRYNSPVDFFLGLSQV